MLDILAAAACLGLLVGLSVKFANQIMQDTVERSANAASNYSEKMKVKNEDKF